MNYEKDFYKILEKTSSMEICQSMKNYIQHGKITTFEHVEFVAKTAFTLNRKLHLKCDEESLVRGAFLHDFYLYDWHKNESFNFHGLKHHKIALKNANKYFSLTKKEKNIIKSHMWPLTIFSLPLCKEAVIVCLSDKYCALYETIFKR
jgi:uncharacterized protein